MTQQTIGGRRALIKERTLRQDAWWRYPLTVWIGLGGFTLYAIYVAFVNNNYWTEPYLSPFYSPCIANNCVDNIYPHFIPLPSNISPALLILVFPACSGPPATTTGRRPTGRSSARLRRARWGSRPSGTPVRWSSRSAG